MKANRTVFILFLLSIFVFNVQSKVNLPSIIGDGMVLQQNSITRIWGKSEPLTKISVRVSWDESVVETMSSDKGYWQLCIKTPNAGGPYNIFISDGDELILEDILIGEVWLCSGQSNMEMPMKGFKGQPIENSQEMISSAVSKRNIRMFTVERNYSRTECDDVKGRWVKNTPENVGNFSAVGYFFADKLQRTLDIPVGIINSSWSASYIEAWLSVESLRNFPEYNIDSIYSDSIKKVHSTPGIMYNAMIKPIGNYNIKGILWYQGESNILEPAKYKKMFKEWLNQNRKLFRNESMPVYYVEIAGYAQPYNLPIQRAVFKEAQIQLMKELNNVGIVTTTDIGDSLFIHPKYKKEIGERLCYWALAKTYCINGIEYCGPIVNSYSINENKIEITFDYAENGLIPELECIDGFELIDKNEKSHPVKANVIRGTNKILIEYNSEIGEFKEIRYCFKNFQLGRLKNTAGLPAAAFRIKL